MLVWPPQILTRCCTRAFWRPCRRVDINRGSSASSTSNMRAIIVERPSTHLLAIFEAGMGRAIQANASSSAAANTGKPLK